VAKQKRAGALGWSQWSPQGSHKRRCDEPNCPRPAATKDAKGKKWCSHHAPDATLTLRTQRP